MRGSILLVMGVCACGSVEGDKKVDARMPDSPKPVDAPDIDAPINTARCNPNAAFGAAQPLTELNSATTDAGASLTSDELTIYFYSTRAGGMGGTDIWVATRPNIDTAFQTPAPLAGVNGAGQDEWPSVTGDGLFLYMDRYGGTTSNWDIYLAQRANTTVDFGAPALVATLNQTGNAADANQMVMSNHKAVYFSTNRVATNDIYRAERNVGGTFNTAVPVIAASTSDESVAVTADELTLFYSSDGPNSMGGHDIYVVKRTTINDGFGQPQQAGVSSADTEHVTWVSPDGCNLYFFRFANANYDLYWARRPM